MTNSSSEHLQVGTLECNIHSSSFCIPFYCLRHKIFLSSTYHHPSSYIPSSFLLHVIFLPLTYIFLFSPISSSFLLHIILHRQIISSCYHHPFPYIHLPVFCQAPVLLASLLLNFPKFLETEVTFNENSQEVRRRNIEQMIIFCTLQ